MKIQKNALLALGMLISMPLFGMEVSYGVYYNKGDRSYEEDRHFVSDAKDFFAVYDGHGGEKMAEYAKNNVHNNYHNATGSMEDKLKKSFEKTSNDFMQNNPEEKSGSTAIVGAIQDNKICFAHAGDSRAMLIRNNTFSCTEDHKTKNVDEALRINDIIRAKNKTKAKNVKSAYITNADVMIPTLGKNNMNRLSMTRSLGDREFKEYGVIATPETQAIDLQDGDMIVLASDGLWDIVDTKVVSDYVCYSSLTTSETDIAKGLGEKVRSGFAAYKNSLSKEEREKLNKSYSLDNLTIIVVFIGTRKTPPVSFWSQAWNNLTAAVTRKPTQFRSIHTKKIAEELPYKTQTAGGNSGASRICAKMF